VNISRFQHEPMPRFTQIVYVFGNPQFIAESVFWESEGGVSQNHPAVRLTESPVIYYHLSPTNPTFFETRRNVISSFG
jgi:hypothetical protein